MSEFSQGQEMLTLALLSARGFWDVRKKNPRGRKKAIRRGLEELAPLKGNWKLVWGPSTYRFLGSAFDSSMMFVVQHTVHKARYAIVVRGTNPVDVLDWLLGDFLAHRQVPWHYSDKDVAPGAALSLSTALGLKILLNMRAKGDSNHVPEPGKFDYLLAHGATTVASVQAAGSKSLAQVGEVLDSPVGAPVYEQAQKLVKKLRKYQKRWSLPGFAVGDIASALGDILPLEEVARMLKLRKRLIAVLDQSMEPFAEAPEAMLMPGLDELSSTRLPGTGLLELLGSLAATHGDELELVVTGHSKGGALAPALALFLSDTQRNDEIPVRRYYQWNPEHRAKISCYAFAGPTPGNTAFASYFNQQLGRHFYRYANKLDIVTLAWRSEELRKISQVYGEFVSSPPGLDFLFREMSEEVENLDYCHPGEDLPSEGSMGSRTEKHVVEFSGPLQTDISSYLGQELHQHIAAYIAFMGLDKVMSLRDVLGIKKYSRPGPYGLHSAQ